MDGLKGIENNSKNSNNNNKTIAFILIGIVSIMLVIGILLIAIGLLDMDYIGMPGNSVAVIHIQGVIISSNMPGGFGIATSGDIINSLRSAEDDSSIQSIVLRINSPGGTPAAAQEIVREMKRITKPIVVSMGDIATSGAYYISAPSDHIIASEDTLTGSIGVIWVFENREAYFKEEGIRHIVFTSGDKKDMGGPWRNLTNEEEDLIDDILTQVHRRFVRTIVDGRNLTTREVNRIADGRIILGYDAKEYGLIDGFGNLQDAIYYAAELGGIIGDPTVVDMNQPSLARLLFGSESTIYKQDNVEHNQYLKKSMQGNLWAIPVFKIDTMFAKGV